MTPSFEKRIDSLIIKNEREFNSVYNKNIRKLRDAYKKRDSETIKKTMASLVKKQDALLKAVYKDALVILHLSYVGQWNEFNTINKKIPIVKTSPISLLRQALNKTRVFMNSKGLVQLMDFEKELAKNLKYTKDILKLTERSLIDAVNRGDSIDKITKVFRKNIIHSTIDSREAGLINYNYKRVVRTELLRAKSLSQEQAFDDVNPIFGIKKKWLTANDKRVRKSHRYMNGKIADENGQFTLKDGIKTKAPRLSGVASEDIQCRCTLVATD